MEILFKAQEITVFDSFEQWVNTASSRIGGYGEKQRIICIDKNSNACIGGEGFMYARDNNLFPVTAYRLIRSSDVNPK